MFFVSGIIIACFCFAFYLIWDQFLKKDSRLSTGLQVLRKKMSELETLSSRISDQINHQSSLIENKSQQLKQLIEKADIISKQLETNLSKKSQHKNNSHLKIVRKLDNSNHPDPLFQLDNSPFLDDENGKEKPSPPPIDPTI